MANLQQSKEIILIGINGKMSPKEFNSHATASPSIVSLITRLRKFSTNQQAKEISNMLDLHTNGYSEEFRLAVSEFYQL